MQNDTDVNTFSYGRDTKSMIPMKKYSIMPVHLMMARIEDLPWHWECGNEVALLIGKDEIGENIIQTLSMNTRPLNPTLYPVFWEPIVETLQMNTSISGIIIR